MTTATTAAGYITNSFPNELVLFNTNEMTGVWFFVLVSHSNTAKKHTVIQAQDSFKGALLSMDTKDEWLYDNTFRVKLGGKPGDSLFFNGKISQVEFIADFYSDDLGTLTELRYGKPSNITRA